ncbi:MAG: hypothetical protein JNM27_05775 [Leptospirales bacterium]|nr:hypothetical protein [Leptospirales bacterium]
MILVYPVSRCSCFILDLAGLRYQLAFVFRLNRFLACVFLLFAGCFDYSESIYFSGDLTGFVEIEYWVPLRNKSEASLISYFQIEKADINKRYSQTLARPVEITDYSKSIEQKPEGNRIGHVKYRVAFRAPGELERILLGKTRVYFHDGRYVIQRNIPSAPALSDDAGRISRRVHELLRTTMTGHKLSFWILYPEQFDLFTNHGTIVRPGVQNLTLPLIATLNNGGVVWTMEIKTNPLPLVSPRTR